MADGLSTWGPDVWATKTFGTTDPAAHALANDLSYGTYIAGNLEPVAFDLYKGVAKHDWKGAAFSFGADALGWGAMFLTNHYVLKPAAERIGFDNVRPMAPLCAKNPQFDAMCTDPTALNQQMPSDHASGAAYGLGATMAKLVIDPEIPKNPWVIGAAIGFGVTTTVATDLLRIRDYAHTLSGTLVGDGVGFLFGFGLPLLENAVGLAPNRWNLALTPTLTAQAQGLRLSGRF